MNREQFLEQRRAGIGGSDVAPILGLSPWKTPLEVYLEKIGEADEIEDTAAMRWGRNLEPVVLQEYADVTGRLLMPSQFVRSEAHGFMLANIDAIASDGRIVEAKTARTAQGWGEPGTAEVPDHYALQVQHYMIVTGARVADIAVLIAGSDFRIYTVEADADLHAMLIDAEREFWRRVVERDPPAATSVADAVARWGRAASAGVVSGTQHHRDAHARLLVLRDEIARLDEEADQIKADLMGAIGDSGDTLAVDGVELVTWKLTKAPERIDTAALKRAHPEIAREFTKPGQPIRRFILKDTREPQEAAS